MSHQHMSQGCLLQTGKREEDPIHSRVAHQRLHRPDDYAIDLTLWTRSDRKQRIILRTWPPTPAARSINKRPEWLTGSNAALKSIGSRPTENRGIEPLDQHKQYQVRNHVCPNPYTIRVLTLRENATPLHETPQQQRN